MGRSGRRLLSNPLNWLRVGTLNQRRSAAGAAAAARLPSLVYRTFLRRRYFGAPLAKYASYASQLQAAGFVHIPRGVIEVEALLDESDAYIRRMLDAATTTAGKKAYLIPLIPADDDYASLPALSRFAVSDDVVGLASAYLGSLPILSYLNIWYSPNRAQGSGEGSQLWHLDHEAFTQIKAFVYLSDVDESAGAMRVLDKERSLARQKEIGYRLGPEHKHLVTGLDDTGSVVLAGKRGDVVIVDTSSCFHRGSDGTGSPRYVAMAQYVPVHAFGRKGFGALKRLEGVSSARYQRPLLGA